MLCLPSREGMTQQLALASATSCLLKPGIRPPPAILLPLALVERSFHSRLFSQSSLSPVERAIMEFLPSPTRRHPQGIALPGLQQLRHFASSSPALNLHEPIYNILDLPMLSRFAFG